MKRFSEVIDAIIEVIERLGHLVIVFTGLILLLLTAWYIVEAKAAPIGRAWKSARISDQLPK